MKLTPQKQVDRVDLSYLADRCRAAGVCLVDEHWTPIGEADPFFARYALPQLKAGTTTAPGVRVAQVTIDIRRGSSATLYLVAFTGTIAGIAVPSLREVAEELPAHTPGSLRRLAADLDEMSRPTVKLAAVSLERDKLSSELADTYEELSLVYRLGSSITVNSPAAEFLAAACMPAAAVMEVCTIGVLVWDGALGEHPPHVFGEHQFTDNEISSIDRMLRRRIDPTLEEAQVLVNETSLDEDFQAFSRQFTQILAVPLRRHGRTLGCVFALDKNVPRDVFGTFNRGVFTSIDRKLLFGVAVHVGLFLENRKLFSDSEALMMGLLHSLTAAVDAKDTYTCGHSVRVALFAKRLAQEAGFDARFCERVYLAGLLHDVGKIGVDDAVLRKPGRLTDEEFAIIKRHPEIGNRILEGIPQVVDILPGVLFHHEKYNGCGYPQRRGGEDIPILGRIMCIADSFDAMTSSRTYRSAMSLGKAMAEIQACKGTHFDPELAEAFCRIPEEEIERLIAVERDRCNIAVTALQQVA